MIDALPDPWWRAAVVVTTALLYDDATVDATTPARAGVERLWATAAKDGLSHPDLAAGAKACFVAAIEALPELGADGATIAATDAHFERFVARGRCPANELLDGWRVSGGLLPAPNLEQAWT